MIKKILYIHNEEKLKFGAHYINDLIIQKLRGRRFRVDNVYPEQSINVLSGQLSGISNILFYYSLINKRNEIKKYDLVQGTTFTPLAFIGQDVKVVSHFGSTTYGFLKRTPSMHEMDKENPELVNIFKSFKKHEIIDSLVPSTKSLCDIRDIETYVARKSDMTIATSENVKKELLQCRVPKRKIEIIHNAIEDYWFKGKKPASAKKTAEIVYLGRMGDDPFTIKLKGLNRLIYVLNHFPKLNKKIIGMCRKTQNYGVLFSTMPKTRFYSSVEKKRIPFILERHFGDVYVNGTRYEGFCLSLIEAMSQGLVPVVFSFGVAPEIIKNGVNGFIVKNVEEMVDKIQMLAAQKNERQRMALEAIETAKLFQADRIIDKYVEFYRRLGQ